MSTVIIHKIGGGSFEIPEGNLENTRRLLGDKIAGVEYKDQAKLEQGFVESLGNNELIVEVIEKYEEPQENPGKKLSLNELKNSDKDVLRALADKLAEDKGITKANGRAGVEKLAEYIHQNQ